MKLFLTAGHSLSDAGAVGNGYQENLLNIEVREELYKRLQSHICVMKEADTLSLSKTINWVNKFSKKEDWLIDIHFNAATPVAKGTEVFYIAGASINRIKIANELSSTISKSLKINDRGGKSDTLSAHGRLGILRDTTPQALLFEICFISNTQDMLNYEQYKHELFDNLANKIIELCK